jgi:hypothetical protein
VSTNCFWTLCSPESTRKLAEWSDDEIETEKVFCPIDPGHQRGGKRLTNLSIILPHGTVQDFVWTWYSECLIQDDVLDLFRRERFTGFDVKSVKARFRGGGERLPKLWELVVTGWAGMARPESGIKRTYFCEACKHTKYSGISDAQRLIDEAQWDGSDFFMVWPMPSLVFVTQRVADCIRDHRLTDVVLKELRELNGIGKDGLGGGRLSYWMPEARARQLGTAAGIEEI